jgi:membrane fusion protein, multidrug efflux system
MKKVIIFSTIIFLIIAALIVSKLVTKSSQEKIKTNVEIISVTTVKASLGKIEGNMSYTGSVEGIHEAEIISQTAGVITKFNLIVGKKCSAGQVLAVVENSQQQAAVEQAKAQVLAAEQNYEKAKLNSDRTDKLYSDKVSTKDNLEMMQLNVKASLAQLKAAQAGEKVAEKQLSDTYIKSTIGGYISNKSIDIGATVAPGSRIAHIVDISKFKILIMVSEADAVKLKPGKNVTVKVDALPNREFEGKINSIGLNSETGSRSYPVEVIIDSKKNEEIKSGMFARCIILADIKNDALLVPENAIVMNSDGSTQVYTVENNKAKLKNVKLGYKDDGKYEILSGLTANEKVVTDGKEHLSDGIEVKEN